MTEAPGTRDGGFEEWLARRRASQSTATPIRPGRRRTPLVSKIEASAGGSVEAVRWAVETMAHERVVFLDTETTGFGPRAEIIDIGIVAADGTVLFDSLIRPEAPIPAATSRVHGLYDHDVAAAPHWRDVYPTIYRLLTGARVVVYNAPFDSGMVTTNCQRHELVIPSAQWHCAMRQYSAYSGAPTTTGNRGAGRWVKLDRAAAAFGVAPGGHRALADAEVCRRVVAGMAAAQDRD